MARASAAYGLPRLLDTSASGCSQQAALEIFSGTQVINIMMKRLLAVSIGLWAVLSAYASVAAPRETENVVLIVLDGVRWQEVFTGADPFLLNHAKAGGNWTPLKTLKAEYWNDDIATRRRMLMPFLWGKVAVDGQIFGNQTEGSKAVVTNDQWFSYPGYNEMSVGVADPKIRSNEFGPNPNVTVFEWLDTLPRYHGQVEIFGTWGTFHEIFNDPRSHLPVRAGRNVVDAADTTPTGQQLLELYRTTTRLEEEDASDAMLHIALRQHLQSHHPKVLFVGYGDTDNWAHLRRYDNVLDTARSADAFIAELWAQLQAIPQYRDHTTFIITTDHGRGSGASLWRDHGTAQPGSNNVWMAVMGPDTAPLGERQHVATVTQSQIAATVAALLGEDYRAFFPKAAAPLPVVGR